MKTITKDDPDIQIFVTPEEEHAPIRGNALASGDDALDRAQEDDIIRQLDAGNAWAWCTVQVRVVYRETIEASDYLGCCSYASEADFRSPNGYFDDMVSACIDEINGKLAKFVA